MNHKQIDQLDLINRYVMGDLLAEESASFEEHFVDCAECIARLQTTENFLKDLRFLAAQRAVEFEPRPASGALRPFLNPFFSRPVALATASLLIAGLIGTFFLLSYMRGLRDEIAQTKSLSEQWQRRYEDERQSSVSAEQIHGEAEARRAEQIRSLEAELKQQKALRAQRSGPIRRLPAEGDLPMLVLTSVRSGEPNPTGPGNRIDLPRAAAIFAVLISLEDEARFETYRITILDDRRRLVWKRGELTQGRQGALSIWLETSLFQPGDYSLIVEGYDKEGRKNEIGNYHFLIDKSR
jgi:anti-sigma factor RsiW